MEHITRIIDNPDKIMEQLTRRQGIFKYQFTDIRQPISLFKLIQEAGLEKLNRPLWNTMTELGTELNRA